MTLTQGYTSIIKRHTAKIRVRAITPYPFGGCEYFTQFLGAAVAEWLSSWLAEQEDRGSIPGLAT